MLVSTSCSFFIHVHSARRKQRLVWYDEFFLFLTIYISISMWSNRILSLFGGLKSFPEDCHDPKFLKHYLLLASFKLEHSFQLLSMLNP